MNMNVEDILGRYDHQVRANAASEPGIHVECTEQVVRISGLWNMILYSQLTESTADAEIAAQIAYFQASGMPVEWKLYGHDTPHDLDTRLERAGFELESVETFLVFDLQNQFPDTSSVPGIRFESVTDARGLGDLASVGERAFGTDYSDMNDEFLARIPLRTVSFYVGYQDDEPVAAGRLETPRDSEFAGLYGGGTVPEFRHQGIYRNLVKTRATEALDMGYRYLTTDAADTSLPILQRLGFVRLTTISAWVWKPR